MDILSQVHLGDVAVEIEIVANPIHEPSERAKGWVCSSKKSGDGSFGRQKEIITSLVYYCSFLFDF